MTGRPCTPALRALIGLGFAAALLGCSDGKDAWVARVNGESIAFHELRRVVEARFEEEPEVPREDILNEELNRIVTEQVVLDRARELEVEVSREDARQRIARLHGSDFEGADDELLDEVRTQMLLERTALRDLVDRIPVPESVLVHYFEENRARYDSPERVELRQIVVEDSDKAARLLEQLRERADFAALAAEHSLAPEAGEGGLLPAFSRGEMPEVFEWAFDARPGALSSVIESPYGFHIFRLEARIPAESATLGELRPQIRQELEQERFAELKKSWLRALRRSAEIDVNEPLLETLR